jgi:hypothetical protein
MDTIKTYSDVIKQIISKYAQFKPSHGNIRLDTLFDDVNHRYALMQVGWDGKKRIRGNLIYVTIQQEKVFIEYDGTEKGITDELITAGIPAEVIVLAFHPLYLLEKEGTGRLIAS